MPVRASGGPAFFGVGIRVLIWGFKLDLGFRLKMLLRRRLWVEAQNTLSFGHLGHLGGGKYFPRDFSF